MRAEAGALLLTLDFPLTRMSFGKQEEEEGMAGL